MKNFQSWFHKIMIALFVGALFVFLFNYFQGYNSSISWNVTTTADAEDLAVFPFSKGPFQFNFDGKTYSLAEVFAAGPIERHYTGDAFFLMGIIGGLCLLLTAFTYLARYWFIGSMVVFIFFLLSLHFTEINLFGFDSMSSGPMIVLLLAYVVPAYLFNAFFPKLHVLWRFSAFVLITGGIILFSGVENMAFQEQFISGSYWALVVLTILFLLIIAEEIVFAILFLVTQSKGGKNNHIHFLVFSVAYLAIIGLHYAQKAGIKVLQFDFFDPYILFAVSACVAFWTLRFKTDYFQKINLWQLRMLFTSLGLIVFTFLAFAFYRGNDAVYEGMHYLITYAHLGFGAFFLFYVILNFITPLVDGQQVYKIIFREQNFPYVSAKLGGLAAVTAFFFLARKEPLFLLRAGDFNYRGAQIESTGNEALANEYYREAIKFGQDNHFASYKLGYHALQHNKIDEAIYRFGRATLRHPSPQAFVNHSGALAIKAEATPALVSLQEGLRIFPGNDYLQNNLGLMYEDQGQTAKAAQLFAETNFSGAWTNAGLVNLWKVNENLQEADEDFAEGNLAVKTNILQRLISNQATANFSFDTASLYPSYTMHRQTYLINASSYFQDEKVPAELEKALTSMVDENIYRTGKNAAALSFYHSRYINQAMLTIDGLRAETSQADKAFYTNELGLIALSEHSLQVALQFFEEALTYGSVPALLNKEACLMELKNYEEALDWAEKLVTIDSLYLSLFNDISAIQNRENLGPDQQPTRLYYYYQEYSVAELAGLIAETDPSYVESLWEKISKEQLLLENYEQLKAYKKVFTSKLDDKIFSEVDMLLALAEGKNISGNHPLATIINIKDDSKKGDQLVELANQNALNEPLVLAIIKELQKLDKSAAYEVLVAATNINKISIPLYKEYILSAVGLGLKDYASTAMKKLQFLTTEEDYSNFNNQYTQKLQEAAEANW